MPATSVDDIRVKDAAPGTSTVTYRSEITFNGIAKLAGPFFKPVFDKNPVQSIGAIAIDPQNKKTIWVGTGEGKDAVSAGSKPLTIASSRNFIAPSAGFIAAKRTHRSRLTPAAMAPGERDRGPRIAELR